MPFLKSGIEYDQVPFWNGSPQYSEQFRRDANQITALLKVNWADAADFRAEVLGYTEYDDNGGDPRLRRTLPLLCPYTSNKYAVSMDLVGYGSDATDVDNAWQTLNEDGDGPENGVIWPAFEADPDFDNWMKSGFCLYRTVFARLPFPILLTDDEVDLLTDGERSRYVLKTDTLNVRELRRPDFGFETIPEAGGETAVRIPIVGFVPDYEREIVYTWFQIPWQNVPRTTIKDAALKVNDATFDGREAETLLFVGAKDIEQPYEGADGSLYCDVKYVFRWKPNGWNKALKSDLTLRRLKRYNVPGDLPPYSSTDLFPDLFVPEAV